MFSWLLLAEFHSYTLFIIHRLFPRQTKTFFFERRQQFRGLYKFATAKNTTIQTKKKFRKNEKKNSIFRFFRFYFLYNNVLCSCPEYFCDTCSWTQILMHKNQVNRCYPVDYNCDFCFKHVCACVGYFFNSIL